MDRTILSLHFTRIFIVALALHLFNLSIDPQDKYPDWAPEDLSVNEIESFTEFFAEVILGKTNAFKEHDERDHESARHGHINIYCLSSNHLTTLRDFYPNILYSHQFQTQIIERTIPSNKEIITPPPKG